MNPYLAIGKLYVECETYRLQIDQLTKQLEAAKKEIASLKADTNTKETPNV